MDHEGTTSDSALFRRSPRPCAAKQELRASSTRGDGRRGVEERARHFNASGQLGAMQTSLRKGCKAVQNV